MNVKKTFFSLLLLCSVSFAEHTVEASAIPEIERFIMNEFVENPPLPDSISFSIKFLPAKVAHTRAGFLFFMGRQNVVLEARYEITGANLGSIKEIIKKDTSWITGYCGMTSCQNKPISAEERIYAQRFLVSQIISELKTRYGSVFKEKRVTEPAKTDSTETTEETAPQVETDSTQTTAVPDTTVAPSTTGN